MLEPVEQDEVARSVDIEHQWTTVQKYLRQNKKFRATPWQQRKETTGIKPKWGSCRD